MTEATQDRSETVAELLDRLTELANEHGGDTAVQTYADGVALPDVATTYEPDEDRVRVH